MSGTFAADKSADADDGESSDSYNIAGRVVDTDGNAIEGAMVYLPLFRSRLPTRGRSAAKATPRWPQGNFRGCIFVGTQTVGRPAATRRIADGCGHTLPKYTPSRRNGSMPRSNFNRRTKRLTAQSERFQRRTGPRSGRPGSWNGEPVEGCPNCTLGIIVCPAWAMRFCLFTVQEWLSQSTDVDGHATIPGITREDVWSVRVEAPSYGLATHWRR